MTDNDKPVAVRDYRKELCIVSTPNSQYPSNAGKWANAALDAFDEKFKGE